MDDLLDMSFEELDMAEEQIGDAMRIRSEIFAGGIGLAFGGGK